MKQTPMIALGILAFFQLLNVTHLEGLASDFSDVILEATTENGTTAVPYELVDKADGQWALLNASMPEGGHSLSVLSSSAMSEYSSTSDPSIIEVSYQDGFERDFSNLAFQIISGDGLAAPVSYNVIGMSEGQWAIVALERAPLEGETVAIYSRITAMDADDSPDSTQKNAEPPPEIEESEEPAPETLETPASPALSIHGHGGAISESETMHAKRRGKSGILIRPRESPVKEIFVEGAGKGNQSIGIDDVPEDLPSPVPSGWLEVYAVDPSGMDFVSAELTATARGNSLYKCGSWDFDARVCPGGWALIRNDLVPGQDYTILLTPEDPAFAEANITIINVQSYPEVGGNWTVHFTTSGTANLSIRAINGTTWDDSDATVDLNFIELRCGDIVLSPVWDEDSKVVLYENYFCSDTGYETSQVLTGGAHHLEFAFGDSVGYADNNAGDLIVTNVTISGSLPTDDLTASYSINNSGADTGIVDWRMNGTSIALFNYPFDMNISDVSSALVKDYSSRRLNATLGSGTASRAPIWYNSSNCMSGGCYWFDGSDDIIIISSPDHNIGSGPFTIEAWVNADTISAYDNIASFGTYSPGFYLYNGYLNLYPAGSSLNAITTGTWYHVAVTRASGGAVTYYINGRANGTTTYSTSVSASPFSIGWQSGEVFDGRIDEFRLYNRSLSPDQILAIYNSGVPSHNVTKSSETELGEQWSACVTASNSTADGPTSCSSNVTIANGIPIGSCQGISSPGIHVLTSDLTGRNGANPECIWVDASGVTLDCQGNDITDDGAGTSYGILINSSVTGFSLENCPNISGYTAGIMLSDTGGHEFSDVGLYGNTYGVHSDNSNDSLFTGITMRANDIGALFEDSYGNNITDSSSGFSASDGIRLVGSGGNKIDPSYFCNNTGNGITVNLSDDTLIEDTVACSNAGYGILVIDSDNATLSDSRLFNNSVDFREDNSLGSAASLCLAGLTFDRPSGDLVNYSKISVNDSVDSGSSYSMNWSAEPAALPDGNISIKGKFLDISTISGSVLIDRFVLHWLSSDVGPYNESSFSLFEYNSSGWALQNGSPDTGANEISITPLVPHSQYGLLGSNSTLFGPCVNLSDASTYGSSINYAGGIYYVNNDTLLCTGNYSTTSTMLQLNRSNIVLDCAGSALDGDDSGTDYGIYFNGFDNITVENCIISDFYYGVYLPTDSDYNTIRNVTSFGNGYYGFYNYYSDYSLYEDNTAYGHTSNYGFYNYRSLRNNYTNNLAFNNSYGFYFTSSSGTTYGAMNVRNNTARSNSNYGFFFSNNDYSNLTGNLAYLNPTNFYLSAQDYSRFVNNTAHSGSTGGFYPSSCTNNYWFNNTAYNNSYAFYLDGTNDNSVFANNTAYRNSNYDFYLYYHLNLSIVNNTAYGSPYGFYITYARNVTLQNNHVFNHSTADLHVLSSTSGILNLSVYNLIVDNPSGGFQNYSNISFNDTPMEVGSTVPSYRINWSSNTTPLASSRVPFAGKFANMTNMTGVPVMESIVWHWNDDELGGQNEDYFELWKHNSSSSWTLLNATPDTSANALSLRNMSFASIYGILEWPIILVSGCMEITGPGTAHLTGNLSGANQSDGNYEGLSCVKISSPNVVLDCRGYDITNNGTGGITAGILANSTASAEYVNITIQNCPGVSGYSYGAYLPYAEVRASNSTFHGNGYNINASSGNLTLANIMLYGAGANDLQYSNNRPDATALNITNALIRRPAGDSVNFTNLTLYDSVASGSSYYLNWSAEPSAGLPSSRASVLGRFVDIGALSSAVNIDRAFWHWTQAEISGYDELLFELWKYNSSGWALLNSSPNTGANTIAVYGHDPSSTYALLENQGATGVTGCQEITSGGIYQLQNSLVGANISDGTYAGNACIKIAADNVLLDCGGYPIEDDGSGTYGILVNGTASVPHIGITLRNCNISGYEYGQYLAYSETEGRDSRIFSNSHNVFLNNTNATLLDYSYYASGADDLHVYDSGSVSLENSLFLNPTGTLQNYSNVTLSDSAASEEYSFAYSTRPAPLPDFFIAFGDKYVNITNISGAVTLDSVKWHYLESEIGGANESRLVLFKHNASGWVPLNSTPDTANNTLSLSNHGVGSTYGLLENQTLMNCPVISSPGTYLMGVNFSGAPNAFASMTACVLITTSNVTFDCNGYSLNHSTSGSPSPVGIAINHTETNITIRNCRINGYSSSIYSNTANITGNNLTNFSGTGVLLAGNTNNLSGNIIHSASASYGISLSTNYNNITNNSVRASSTSIYNSNGDFNSFSQNTITAGSYGIYAGSAAAYNNYTSNRISNVTYGIMFENSPVYSRVIANNISNTTNGIDIRYNSDANLVANNTIYNSSSYCIYIYAASASTTYYCDNNNITNNSISRCGYGIFLQRARYTRLVNNTIANASSYGVYVSDNIDLNLSNDHYINNTQDFYVVTSTTARTMRLTNEIFDSRFGNYSDFTNLSIVDTVAGSSSYTINWTSNTSALPAGKSPFAGKFLNISRATGNVTLESVTWHWADSESAPYDEALFELWKYNSTGWTLVNNTPNDTDNHLSLYDHNVSSIYGILQTASTGIDSCREITSEGTYKLTSDITGAPVNASPVVGMACIKIAASNVVLDCDGYNITDNESGTTYGIVLNGSISNVTVKDCTGIGGYTAGINVRDTNFSTFTNNSAFGLPSASTIWGFYIGGNSTGNVFSGNALRNLTQHGFKVDSTSTNNSLIRNSIFDSAVGFSINGNNNTIDNNSIYRCSSGIEVEGPANNTVKNNLALNISSGCYSTLGGATETRFINNTARNCSTGFYVLGEGNLLANNTAYENTNPSGTFGYGFEIYSPNSTYVNNSAYNNTLHGFYLAYASNVSMADCRAFNNGRSGITVEGVNTTSISGGALYGNGRDLLINGSGSGMEISISNVIFDNPSGGLDRFTNLSLNDTVSAASAYSVNWTSNSTALPSGYSSFRGKFANISTLAGSVSIDSIAWHWTDGEAAGYMESFFELYKYNSSGWSLVSSSPDLAGNRFVIDNLVPGSDYGILQSVDIGDCMEIDAQGTFQLSGNLVGANISTPELMVFGGNMNTSFACIKISSSNVTLDCNGYSIVNDGTENASGIAVAATNTTNYTNIEIRNCPDISGYTNGIFLPYTHYSRVLNVSLNNWNSGITLGYSNYNNVTDVYSANANDGIMANSYCSYNLFANNTLFNNTYGIAIFHFSTNNTLINNTAIDSNWYGLYSYHESNGTWFENNTVYDGGTGIYTWLNRDERIINNTAYNNTRGISVDRSNYCNVSLNTVYGNRYGIEMYFNANHTLISDNEVFNNSRYGLFVHQSTNLTIRNIHLYGNGNDSGFLDNDNLEPALTTFVAYNMTIDSPGGQYQNYTRFNITDTIEHDTGYVITWAAEPPSLPSETISFEGKFANISRYNTGANPPISIDEIIWHWDDSELGSIYNESGFELWKYNSSSWKLVSGAPDTDANTFAIYGLDPESTYGILNSSRDKCRVIIAPETYTLGNDLEGAPSAVSSVPGVSHACIVVASSDVAIDCNGYSISHDAPSGTAGIIINGTTVDPYSNISIMNCPDITGYEYGIYGAESDNVEIANTSVHDNPYGMIFRNLNLMDSPDNLTIRDSSSSSADECFFLYGMNNVTLSNLNASNCTYQGFRLHAAFLDGDMLRANDSFEGLTIYASSLSGMRPHDLHISNSEFFGCDYGLSSYIDDGTGFISNVSIENVESHDNGFAISLNQNLNFTIKNSSAHDNTFYGARIDRTGMLNTTGLVFYANDIDLFLTQYGWEETHDVHVNALFLPDSGEYSNYSNVTLDDSMPYGDAFYINWYPFIETLPPGRFSFGYKFLGIELPDYEYDRSVDQLIWHWTDDEVSAGGYNESLFELWLYNESSEWVMENDTPDESENELRVLNITSFGVFGPMQNNASGMCPVLNESGAYSQTMDFSGAPNTVEIPGYPTITDACVVIESSDVEFDCQGFVISHDGSVGSVGILINTSLENVTLKNCDVSGYENGIVSIEDNDTFIDNSTSSSNSQNGFLVRDGFRAAITNSTADLNGNSGFNLLAMQDSNLSGNAAIENGDDGFSFYSSTGCLVDSSIAEYNYGDGFNLFGESSGNTIINSTATSNVDGFVVAGDSRGGTYSVLNNLTNNSASYNAESGFLLTDNAENNTIHNCTSHDNSETGYHVVLSWGNNLSGNLAYMNPNAGFNVSNASLCLLVDNQAYSTSQSGFHLDASSDNNTLVRNVAYSNSQQGFLITSNAGNNLTNNTAHHNSYGFYWFEASGNSTGDIAYSNEVWGVYGDTITGTGFNNVTSYLNGHGFFLLSLSESTLSGCTAYENSNSGIDVRGSSNVNISGSSARNNRRMGISFDTCTGGTHMNNTASGNTMCGLALASTNATFIDTHLYNQTGYDACIGTGKYGQAELFIVNMTIDSPLGAFENHTSINLSDYLNSSQGYSINWTSNSSALPSDRFSFAQKLVNITGSGGSPSIENIQFTWQDDEAVDPYDESLFELWKYDLTGGWVLLNDTPNTSSNTLSLSNFTPSSDYGILQNNVSQCLVIEASGEYAQAGDLTGAPNPVNIGSYPTLTEACIIVEVSDVIYDCAGFSISHNGTSGSIGVLVNLSLTNVTILNCFVDGYENGFISIEDNDTYFINNTAYNNTQQGFLIRDGNRTVLENNTAEGNGNNGFGFLGHQSGNLTGNLAFNNTQGGFSFFSATGFVLDGNRAENNSGDGFSLTDSCFYNTLRDNSAYYNAEGFFVSGSSRFTTYSSFNTLENNSAWQNSQNGFLLAVNADNNSVSSCTSYGNGLDGFRLQANLQNNLTNGTSHSNARDGFALDGTGSSTIVQSVSRNNTRYGIYALDSGNALINSTRAYNNSYGAYLVNLTSSNFSMTNLTNNTNDGMRMDSSSSGNRLESDYICHNGFDMNNLGSSNEGEFDRCDSFVGWAENSHYGCEYSCSSMWHRFFGNVSGDIILGTDETALVYSWNASAFNIYFTDTDSAISWGDLQAIGRDSTGSASSDDFTELDTAFGTSAFQDNINVTYSSDGSVPLDTAMFTVYGTAIPNVPVANSTAFNTTFRTGILWDMNDGGTEYSNAINQSTVWVAAINASSADVYGTYDYLLQVPYALSTYEGGNDTVSIYLELQ